MLRPLLILLPLLALPPATALLADVPADAGGGVHVRGVGERVNACFHLDCPPHPGADVLALAYDGPLAGCGGTLRGRALHAVCVRLDGVEGPLGRGGRLSVTGTGVALSGDGPLACAGAHHFAMRLKGNVDGAPATLVARVVYDRPCDEP